MKKLEDIVPDDYGLEDYSNVAAMLLLIHLVTSKPDVAKNTVEEITGVDGFKGAAASKSELCIQRDYWKQLGKYVHHELKLQTGQDLSDGQMLSKCLRKLAHPSRWGYVVRGYQGQTEYLKAVEKEDENCS